MSSTSARFAGQVVSDGGEPITLSLFWGDEDGGDSTIVDPSSPVSWDARIDLNSTQSTGAFDFFQDGMDKNKSYYYRWLGGNSVTSEVWSLPTMEGLANMWEFDENTGNEVVNLINSNNGLLVGMSDADRVFGYKRKALSFDDDGGHLVVRGYKGISRNLPRTLSLWVKTSDQNGSLVSWGDSSNGGIWDFGLENGRLKLNTGGASLYGTSLVNIDQWKHVSVALPNGSGLLADCLLYVDGEEETTTITPFTWSPISLNPQVWFDANDTSSLTYDLSNVISAWQDKSTFTRDATTSLGAPVFNSSTGPNGMPTVEIRRDGGNDALSISGSAFFAKDHFYVFRSTGVNFDYYGGVLGQGGSYPQSRRSNYLFENGRNYFHSNIYPTGIAQNGFALITTGNRMLKNIDQFMILRLQVDDQSVGPHSTYRIGTISDGNNWCASIDVSEILAFNTVLSEENAMRIEGYLAHKWGLGSKLATDHPYAKALGYAIDTGVDMDLMVGSDGDTNHFGGIIDELRIYDRGLSSDEIMSIALDGTVRFTTSAIPQPPTVEILEITPDYNGTAVIKGILTGKDENLPVVSVYFGRTDAGFNQAGWEHNASVNGGIPVGLGEFNASVSGLIPGETYYFRTFAQSADGIDWSSGAPEVSLDLLAYWRMDESNGSSLDDSFTHFITRK